MRCVQPRFGLGITGAYGAVARRAGGGFVLLPGTRRASRTPANDRHLRDELTDSRERKHSGRGGAPLGATGYPVLRGNSYIQTVTRAAGCSDEQGAGCDPIAEDFVTYSQSTDPASPHFRDQTEGYSRKTWIRFPFTEETQIGEDPELVIERLVE